jgi:hypothetical protein
LGYNVGDIRKQLNKRGTENMAEGKIFVGREAELEQFKKALEDPRGQAILVIGRKVMVKDLIIGLNQERNQWQ